jgi:hypothetical protein
MPSKLMRLVLHPKVYSDIDEIMGYYERVATPGARRGLLHRVPLFRDPGRRQATIFFNPGA